MIGRKFFIPAEYDIYIAFAPIYNKNKIESPSGKLRLRSKYLNKINDVD
jgi:hypothetical protein